MATNRASDDLAQQIGKLFEGVNQLDPEGRYREAIAVATQARDLARRQLGHRSQDTGNEPVEGARRTDPGADGQLLPPPPRRPWPRRRAARGVARDEGQIPRSVLLVRLHLPGGSRTAPGHFHLSTNHRRTRAQSAGRAVGRGRSAPAGGVSRPSGGFFSPPVGSFSVGSSGRSPARNCSSARAS
jgi:hypothetical protein